MKRIFWIFVFFIGLTGSLNAQLMGGLIIPQPAFANQYPAGTVFCAFGPTAIVDVVNPTTGRTWMDRNLGASQAATSSTDASAYGDLYQWGRRADGHQCRNSSTTTTLSSSDQPSHGSFIITSSTPYDWRSPQNTNLWQGVNGVNNPCPSGYRLPTETELNAERLSWSSNNAAGAFGSILKLPMGGGRDRITSSLYNMGSRSYYWSSSFISIGSRSLDISNSGAIIFTNSRAFGLSIRCIKDLPLGTIGALDCNGATTTGTLVANTAASGVSTSVPYTGGNGGMHNGQTVTSTGVTGLTASLSAGTFANGAGNLTYSITGTPSTSGTASFALNIGGQSCTLNVSIDCWSNHNTTALVDVVNPTTGRTWMDRNLGASQAATSSTDAAAYGDLYQWGRGSDGHQCRNSATSTTLSSTNQPTHGNFILVPNSPFDWRSPQNTGLWQGVNGTNNPCPSGYRLPTETELNAERLSWSTNNTAGAFGSILKLTLAGSRSRSSGSLGLIGSEGRYWSNSVNFANSRYLLFSSGFAGIDNGNRASGFSVRCIKELPPGAIGVMDCTGATTTGTLVANTAASGISTSVPYTGGNGGMHNGQTVTSTGVTGLTATLAAGTFANGAGSLTYSITGTPSASGTASFALNIGGQSCTLNVSIDCWSNHNTTALVDVVNPTTGRTWMDRNLGASQAATSSTDAAAYGDLYQWGRGADGHQCRTSSTTSTLSSTDTPAHGSFILVPNSPNDWRSPQNTNLWQGVNGVNNPCPNGYRIPTETELNAERLSWSNNNAAGAYGSMLKLPMGGARIPSIGSLVNVGIGGRYWSSNVSSTGSRYLFFDSSSENIFSLNRATGFSVRCIKELPPGAIGVLDCTGATTTGTLVANTAASGVSTSVPYTGGNGGTHSGQTVSSTGVTGLTATLSAGSFANGAGNLTYSITGTPISSGTASFALSIGGQSCTLNVSVDCWSNHNTTGVVDVINPSTGRTWMDRNLGASQAATSSTDAAAYGDLYQWGRGADGHQCRTSATTTTLSSTDQPGHGSFITINSGNYDWRSPQNTNLWQGVNGINNPCPSGYRLPTETELNAERTSWSSNNAAGAFASTLKLPKAGNRHTTFGSFSNVGVAGYYWSSVVSTTNSRNLVFSSGAVISSNARALGFSVRCIKD